MFIYFLLPVGASMPISESVIFHKVEQIQTSKSSWIISSAIDFQPYIDSMVQIGLYSGKIVESLIELRKDTDFEIHHKHLIRLTLHDVNSSVSSLNEAHTKFFNIIDSIHGNYKRHKRSLLPLGHLFSFLFGTANQDDIEEIKKEVKTIYDNQINQAEVLSDVISITNVSRTLINENRLLINSMINTIRTLNSTFIDVQHELLTLFTTRKFLLTHAETLIHSHRLRVVVETLKQDVNKFEQYLVMLSLGKLNPALISPKLLINELSTIQKQLPPTISLPEDPNRNIWHYYRFLTVSYMPHEDKIIFLVKIPLIDNDAVLDLYKVYNLPVFNPILGKSLKYNVEGYTLAVSLDRNYATIPTETEFIECTLASGHFCNLRSALYHMQSSNWCIFALFMKNEDLINANCGMSITNITGPVAIYLDQGNWAVATMEPDQMEVSCPVQKHIISLNPPLTLVNLQPACSAFSSMIKLPPYFSKFSHGFTQAVKNANLHSLDFKPTNFRAWKSLEVSNLSEAQISNLKKLNPIDTVPVKILKAKISKLKEIDLGYETKDWIFIGGGSGSGILLLVIVCLCVYCKCKKHFRKSARSSINKSDTDLENHNMMHTKVDAIRSEIDSDLGRETVRIQGSERPIKRVRFYEQMYSPESSRLLDQLERFGIDVTEHRRTLRPGTHTLSGTKDFP